MRLCFPNNEHADVLVAPGGTAIGAAADNTVVIERSGIAAHHASIEVADRSIVLRVLDTRSSVHVNARPVRSMAMLHLGDVVSLDSVQFLIKPDSDSSIRVDVPARMADAVDGAVAGTAGAPTRVVLRGVSGSYFGKIVPVNGQLTIGTASDCGLVLNETQVGERHAQIENVDDAIFLRDLGSANGTLVNGVRVRDAVLHPDDQIAFEHNRFLIEAPGLPLRSGGGEAAPGEVPNITQTMRAVPRPAADGENAGGDAAGGRSGLWWLVGVAVLIAIGLVVLFSRY